MKNGYKDILKWYVKKLETRFWKMVKKTDSCWVWKGTQFGHGYGNFRCCGDSCPAHRMSWIITHGRIPEKMHVLHHCDNRLCVRPSHLWIGTHMDNVIDKVKKKRHDFGEKHPGGRLTEKQIIEIRSLYKPHVMTAKIISEKYGISISNVYSIVKNIIWRHIPPTS